VSELLWNISGMILIGKTRVLRGKPAQCHFVHQKFCMGKPGIKSEPQRWKTGD